MLGNIGDPFVKCMRQVTKGHLYHLFEVSNYYIMYRQSPSSIPYGPQLGPGWAKLGPGWAPVGPNWGPFGNAAWEGQFCEISAQVTDWVTDPFRMLMSPLTLVLLV